jgi:hypothetical protein
VADQAEPFEQARVLYEQAVFNGDDGALPAADRILDATEAGLALARGRVMHARFLAHRQEDPQELALFERAAALYHRLGDVRGEGESLFWAGTFHQVVRGDDDAAGPPLEQAWSLAQTAGGKLTLSYVVRHLGLPRWPLGAWTVPVNCWRNRSGSAGRSGLPPASPQGCSRWLNWPPAPVTGTGH